MAKFFQIVLAMILVIFGIIFDLVYLLTEALNMFSRFFMTLIGVYVTFLMVDTNGNLSIKLIAFYILIILVLGFLSLFDRLLEIERLLRQR